MQTQNPDDDRLFLLVKKTLKTPDETTRNVITFMEVGFGSDALRRSCDSFLISHAKICFDLYRECLLIDFNGDEL